MRVALIILVGILALASQSNGVTQTSAFTSSFLVSNYSNLAASKTISESSVVSPDLNYNSKGQVESYVIQPDGGGATISQKVYSTAESYGGMLGGIVSFSNKITATQVKNTSLVMTGTSSPDVSNKQNNSEIESQTFGLGMAKPGDGGYSFEVKGAQNSVCNIAPFPAIIPIAANNTELLNKELIIAFEQTPMEFEQPADILQQEVNFNYGTSNNQPTFYGYDFTSTLEVGDTICSSSMSFSHVN